MDMTWRWFGPDDDVLLSEVRQAGATGIVTALHQMPPGVVWTREEIAQRKAEISHPTAEQPSGLVWQVVESLPVSEDIKTNGELRDLHVANWIESLRNLAAEGLTTICYNFMPVLDWTRTELTAPMPNGAKAMRFDLVDFALFDMHILKRDKADAGYPQDVVAEAAKRVAAMSKNDKDALCGNILAGLPGAMEHWTLEEFGARLGTYQGIDADTLRANLASFLREVVPVAEELGVRICCHPDDPPWPLLGLPRIMSTETDYQWLVDVVPSPANGITMCSGSLGARADNDIPGMIDRLGSHIHFLHLRNVRREFDAVPCSFFEDEHLLGQTDMVATVQAILREEQRRFKEGRADWAIPMRPDHGQDIMDDLNRPGAPGYPAVGRMKGLAELRGIILAVSALDESCAAT